MIDSKITYMTERFLRVSYTFNYFVRIKSLEPTTFEIRHFRILHGIFTRGLLFGSSHFIYFANVTLVNGDRHRWCISKHACTIFAFALFHDVDGLENIHIKWSAKKCKYSTNGLAYVRTYVHISFSMLSWDIATFG